MIRCIAIDDEPLALRQIKGYIQKTPSLELVATCRSAADAMEVISREKVDLIFVDINMPDVSGLDFVKSLPDDSRPMIIFTTAYSEFAVDGFRLNAVDYLLKPFGLEEFSRAAYKAQRYSELKRLNDEGLAAQESDTAESGCITVKADHKVILVKHSDIVYVESDSEYVRLVLSDGSKIMTLLRLKNVESMLPSDMFMRIHRSYIINLRRIKSYSKGRVYIDDDVELPIGENYREAFTEYVDKSFPSS